MPWTIFIVIPVVVAVISAGSVFVAYRFWLYDQRSRHDERRRRFAEARVRLDVDGPSLNFRRELNLLEAFSILEIDLEQAGLDRKSVRTLLEFLENRIVTSSYNDPDKMISVAY